MSSCSQMGRGKVLSFSASLWAHCLCSRRDSAPRDMICTKTCCQPRREQWIQDRDGPAQSRLAAREQHPFTAPVLSAIQCRLPNVRPYPPYMLQNRNEARHIRPLPTPPHMHACFLVSDCSAAYRTEPCVTSGKFTELRCTVQLLQMSKKEMWVTPKTRLQSYFLINSTRFFSNVRPSSVPGKKML